MAVLCKIIGFRSMRNVVIYTDGACSGNPGVGGWAAIMLYDDGEEMELCGFEDMTTNNRMELMAAIKALENVRCNGKVVLYTDSQYVKNGITSWIYGWIAKSWKTANNKPVKNVDLWIRLYNLQRDVNIEWAWVRGHSSDEGNNRVDKMARDAILNRGKMVCR